MRKFGEKKPMLTVLARKTQVAYAPLCETAIKALLMVSTPDEPLDSFTRDTEVMFDSTRGYSWNYATEGGLAAQFSNQIRQVTLFLPQAFLCPQLPRFIESDCSSPSTVVRIDSAHRNQNICKGGSVDVKNHRDLLS